MDIVWNMENCEFYIENGVGILEFSRPEALNALNSSLLEEVLSIESDLNGLIVTGKGEKAFAAGADIREMVSLERENAAKYFQLGQKVASFFEKAPFVTLAAVNGYAFGGGLEMALGCDFIYASGRAKLGFPEVSIGLIPGFGGVTRLIEAVGLRRAKEMIYTGYFISAHQALEWGLINRVVEEESLLEECKKAMKRILKNDFSAVLEAKKAIAYRFVHDREEALENEITVCTKCHQGKGAQKLMKRFVEK